MSAIDTELMTSLPRLRKPARITCALQYHQRWSVFRDKRHGVWRAAEDDPDSDLSAGSRDTDTVISYTTAHS
jgi:hypothetical protein